MIPAAAGLVGSEVAAWSVFGAGAAGAKAAACLLAPAETEADPAACFFLAVTFLAATMAVTAPS
jgi:hypothetical protein